VPVSGVAHEAACVSLSNALGMKGLRQATAACSGLPAAGADLQAPLVRSRLTVAACNSCLSRLDGAAAAARQQSVFVHRVARQQSGSSTTWNVLQSTWRRALWLWRR